MEDFQTANYNKYLKYFLKLQRGFSKNLGKAPHKPVLLLSVIQEIKNGNIDSNKIFITANLILTFRKIWSQIVETKHLENFALPFFHLRSEPFWFLISKPGKQFSLTGSRSVKSFKNLKETIAYAEIEKNLFFLLKNPVSQSLLENSLLNFYFPNSKNNYSHQDFNLFEKTIENEILNEPTAVYQQQILRLREILKDDDFEEEIFIRGGLFKKTVPKIYDYTCCISGLQINSAKNVQMVDACHIYPFSLSNDDTVPNGLALSPTMHRAFDRGLITINKDFIVRVSPTIKEENSKFSLSQFEGQKILLPKNEKWYPSQESLSWHNKEVFLI